MARFKELILVWKDGKETTIVADSVVGAELVKAIATQLGVTLTPDQYDQLRQHHKTLRALLRRAKARQERLQQSIEIVRNPAEIEELGLRKDRRKGRHQPRGSSPTPVGHPGLGRSWKLDHSHVIGPERVPEMPEPSGLPWKA